MIHTCKDCPDRHAECHCTCEKYLVAKKIHDEERERAYREKRGFLDFVDIKVRVLQANRKRRGR